jgi:hypothetical protein
MQLYSKMQLCFKKLIIKIVRKQNLSFLYITHSPRLLLPTPLEFLVNNNIRQHIYKTNRKQEKFEFGCCEIVAVG